MQFLAGPSASLQREERRWFCPRLARTFRSSVGAGILPEMSAPTEMCPVHRHVSARHAPLSAPLLVHLLLRKQETSTW